MHADLTRRDSLALDLLEPIRPAVDRFVLELIAETTFSRADFTEQSDGTVRIAPALVQRIAATMPVWAKAVAPHAEQLAHLLGRHVAGKWTPRTPLTARNSRAAQATAKARKANAVARGQRSIGPKADSRQLDAHQATLAFVACIDCGAPVARSRHLRCPACWDTQPSQARETRQRRGRAIAESRAELERWKADHPGLTGDPDDFRRNILPGLAEIKLAEIVTACGVSKSTASTIRSGRHVPALRHWSALARLAGIGPSQFGLDESDHLRRSGTQRGGQGEDRLE